MQVITYFWRLLVFVLLGPAVPQSFHGKPWERFFFSLTLSAVGIGFPLYVFVMSQFLVPVWKGGCNHGWLDCFHVGKLALTPLVIWACAAFYVVRIHGQIPKNRRWVELGLFMGAIISCICFILGLVIHGFGSRISQVLVVPLYVSVWYSLLWIRAARALERRVASYVVTLLGSIPFWVSSVCWSKSHYLKLPDEPPNCFVVTAALRGHKALVGPFENIARHGAARVANEQLQTFWQFEEMWSSRCPTSHRVFRRFYNRIGPMVAGRIKSKFAADSVYLLLKPVEVIAALVVLTRK